MRLKADLTLLAVAMLWGSAFAAQRVAANLGSVYFFNGARFLLAALILFPFAFKSGIRPRQWIWMGVAGAILFLASALQQAGLVTTSAGNAGFITSMYVVLVPFVVWLVWGERPAWVALVAAVLAVFGAYLLSAPGDLSLRSGDALEGIAALFWAMHVVVVGKYAWRYNAVSFSAGQLVVGGCLNLAASLIWERPGLPLPIPILVAIVYTAVASLGLGYTLQIWGQRHTPPTDAAIILSLESVFAVAAGWLLLQEALAPVQILGCFLILGAVLLSQAGRRGRIAELETGGP